MNTRRVVEILRNEYVCAEREDCDRACCARCDLVMDRNDVLTALRVAIGCVFVQACKLHPEDPDRVAFLSEPELALHWISVNDALPMPPISQRTDVIAYNGREVLYMLYEPSSARGKTAYRWRYPWNRFYDGPKITHWMPLPEPPAGKEE